jgi:hypothetical protein
MKPTPRTPTAQRATKQTAAFTADLREKIRRRAYELYEQRGREDGRDLDDWLQAESEVTKKKAKTATA